MQGSLKTVIESIRHVLQDYVRVHKLKLSQRVCGKWERMFLVTVSLMQEWCSNSNIQYNYASPCGVVKLRNQKLYGLEKTSLKMSCGNLSYSKEFNSTYVHVNKSNVWPYSETFYQGYPSLFPHVPAFCFWDWEQELSRFECGVTRGGPPHEMNSCTPLHGYHCTWIST